MALHRAGKPAEAVPFYDAALALSPGNAEVLTHRGTALCALGRID